MCSDGIVDVNVSILKKEKVEETPLRKRDKIWSAVFT